MTMRKILVVLAAVCGGCFGEPDKTEEEHSAPQSCLEAWNAIVDNCVEEWDAQEAQCEDGESDACTARRTAFDQCEAEATGHWTCDEEDVSRCPQWAALVCDLSPGNEECEAAEATCTSSVRR